MHHHAWAAHQNTKHAGNNPCTEAGDNNNLCTDARTIDDNTAYTKSYLSNQLSHNVQHACLTTRTSVPPSTKSQNNIGHIRALTIGWWQIRSTIIDHHTTTTTFAQNAGTPPHDGNNPHTEYVYHHRQSHRTMTSTVDSNCTNYSNYDEIIGSPSFCQTYAHRWS